MVAGVVTAAAGGMAAWWPGRARAGVDVVPQPKRRWEWEAEEWKWFRHPVSATNSYWSTCERNLSASVTLCVEEVASVMNACGRCNADTFCGVASGRLRCTSIFGASPKDGLVNVTIVLRQTVGEQDVLRCMSPNYLRIVQHTPRVDFCSLFPGEHAIVSIGGKEVG
jgi:hypothetical protein